MNATTQNTGSNFWLDRQQTKPEIKSRPQVETALWLLSEFVPTLTAQSAEQIADVLIDYVGYCDSETADTMLADSFADTQDTVEKVSTAIADRFGDELSPAIADGIIDTLHGYKEFCGEDGADRIYNPDTSDSVDKIVGEVSAMLAEYYGDVMTPDVADGLIAELNEYKQNEKD